ncbi:MAG: FecCD family ABC transporter permease [Nitriliruptoraceae bacterium]
MLLGLSALLAAVALLNAVIGAVPLPPAVVAASLAERVGIDLAVPVTDQQAAVLWAIRLPRIALAGVVGAALALCGAVMQGIFRNPLAEPGIIGVSSGAALGAVIAILAGGSFTGGYLAAFSIPLAAFLGALVATAAVYLTARHEGRTEVVTLVLCGIAVSAIAGAGVGLAQFVADDDELRSIVFWTLGSASGARWRDLLVILPLVVIGSVVAIQLAAALNLLVLGEREARYLGVSTEQVRLTLIVVCALVTGAAVAVAGIVGFVGLVVPHLVRLALGPDHELLLPASTLAGASLLLLADLAARTVAAPAELPLGVVTALIGGPFFFWLLRRTRRDQGAWG